MEPITRYKNARKKLLLLDYDGTLVNFTLVPEDAKPSVRLLNILYKLCCSPSTELVVITDRDYRSIDRLLGHLPIDIIAEHGTMMKQSGMWNDQLRMNILWKHEFLPILEQFASECKGSFVEEKRFSVAWHYRNVDMLGGHVFSRELIRAVRKKTEDFGLRIIDGEKAVEIIMKEGGKGKIVSSLLEKRNYDYILAIGDGATDEDMFEVLKDKGNCSAIKVGYGKTCAKYRLDSPADVILFLEQLTFLS